MDIEVLGPGCRRCEQLYENTVSAVSQLEPSANVTIKKVSDMNYFVKMGVFVTPGLIIDGKVVSTGKLLTPEEILDLIKENI
jgi:small redox-active disulfide protein 2